MPSDKSVTWTQGIAVVGGAFSLCVTGFVILHSMILADKTFASDQLSSSIIERNQRIDKIVDRIESFQSENYKQHQEIIMLLNR